MQMVGQISFHKRDSTQTNKPKKRGIVRYVFAIKNIDLYYLLNEIFLKRKKTKTL